MSRIASPEELQARVAAGDKTFLTWLQGPERRAGIVDGPTRKYLAAYFRSVLSTAPGLVMVLHVGCGLGLHADSLTRAGHAGARFVGLDYDPECIRLCRRRFKSLKGYQFHSCDYLRPPKIPQNFDLIVVSDALCSLPGYADLLGKLWQSCKLAMIVVMETPLRPSGSDFFQLHGDSRLSAAYSKVLFSDFVSKLSEVPPDFRTVYADTNDSCEHLALVRKTASVPDFSGIHRFAEAGSTFPYSVKGFV